MHRGPLKLDSKVEAGERKGGKPLGLKKEKGKTTETKIYTPIHVKSNVESHVESRNMVSYSMVTLCTEAR